MAASKVITWNDFGEGTMIEPTIEFQYTFLETIQQYTGVVYTKTELQLIYQWFALRKKYKNNKSVENKITQAYYDLVSPDADAAEKIISAID
jgi:hypothetical protein